jgi:hypothetical protein
MDPQSYDSASKFLNQSLLGLPRQQVSLSPEEPKQEEDYKINK